MKTLKLSDEKALELYKTADDSFKQLLEENFGKDFFKLKLITDIVYDTDSLANYLGISHIELFIYSINTTDKHKRYINACNILAKVAQVYNQGTVLDWKNTREYKYLPYLDFFNSGGVVFFSLWLYCLDGSTGLYYKSKELSEKSYNNFKKYWEDYWMV